jgi:riboflavin kinase/FMN adenylyltransferase
VKVVRGLQDAHVGPTVATVGAFAVVHRGHATLLDRVRTEAGRLQAAPALLTFEAHPQEVLHPENAPCVLATLDQRLEQFEAAGLETVVVVPFTIELSQLSPEEFVRMALVDTLGVRKVVVGEDFRFGHRRVGDIATLERLGADLGFSCEAIGLVEADGHKVSSSQIRALVGSGRLEEATELWGRAFRLAGEVVPGDKRGRDLGFPTANIRPYPRACLPATGVYAGRWLWRGREYPSAINVGFRPTFTPAEHPLVEVHILDFDQDIYGEQGEVEFTARLRDEVRFESAEALVEQMHRDAARAKRLLAR